MIFHLYFCILFTGLSDEHVGCEISSYHNKCAFMDVIQCGKKIIMTNKETEKTTWIVLML